jgi:hypothetical protein
MGVYWCILMGILMYICLLGRYFLNPFNGCSYYFKTCLIYLDSTTAMRMVGVPCMAYSFEETFIYIELWVTISDLLLEEDVS